MAHRIEKPFRKANFIFKLYASSFSVQPYGSLRYAVFIRISSFLKGFGKLGVLGIITLLLACSFSSVDAGFINVSLGGGGATGDLPVPAELGLPFENTVRATQPIVLVIKEAIKYVGLLAILALSWWGIQFLTSMGNDEKVKGAKHTIIYALVGVLLSVVAYTIIDIVNSLRI